MSDRNGIKYWIDGIPSTEATKSGGGSSSDGSNQYWNDGLPNVFGPLVVTTLSISVSESISVTERVAFPGILTISVFESIHPTEHVLEGISRRVSDSISVLERELRILPVFVHDSISTSENLVGHLLLGKLTSDSVSISENVKTHFNAAYLVVEQISVIERAGSSPIRLVLVEVISTREALVLPKLSKLLVSVFDSISVQEIPNFPYLISVGHLGIGPAPTNSNASYLDYWVVGI